MLAFSLPENDQLSVFLDSRSSEAFLIVFSDKELDFRGFFWFTKALLGTMQKWSGHFRWAFRSGGFEVPDSHVLVREHFYDLSPKDIEELLLYGFPIPLGPMRTESFRIYRNSHFNLLVKLRQEYMYRQSLWHLPFLKLSLNMDPQTLLDAKTKFVHVHWQELRPW